MQNYTQEEVFTLTVTCLNDKNRNKKQVCCGELPCTPVLQNCRCISRNTLHALCIHFVSCCLLCILHAECLTQSNWEIAAKSSAESPSLLLCTCLLLFVVYLMHGFQPKTVKLIKNIPGRVATVNNNNNHLDAMKRNYLK